MKVAVMSDEHVSQDFINEHGFVYAFHREDLILYALVKDANSGDKLWRARKAWATYSLAPETIEFPHSKFNSIEQFIAYVKLKQLII